MQRTPEESKTENQPILHDGEKNVELWLKREDSIHPEISGNKWRKLKYNLLEADRLKHHSILTFGGAHSNHILATAAAARKYKMKSIGVIRGEELGKNREKTIAFNPTLDKAENYGMKLQFISRTAYRQKNSPNFVEGLHRKWGSFYLIPEGGSNERGVFGCREIVSDMEKDFDILACPVGTGGTIAGLIQASGANQRVLGFPALKGDFLKREIQQWVSAKNWSLCSAYHFGGYAKVNAELIDFINDFKRNFGIQLDPVYTGKMLYGLMDLIREGYFTSGTKILAIHTGGLQGIPAMNHFLKKRSMPMIA